MKPTINPNSRGSVASSLENDRTRGAQTRMGIETFVRRDKERTDAVKASRAQSARAMRAL